MDHQLAETQQWADKYTLNEMSAAERTQFEEHLFDCPICSEQVRRSFMVIENLTEVLREEKANLSQAKAQNAGWRDWFRLPSLVPSFAALALACVVVFQGAAPGTGYSARVLTPAAMVAPVSRGDKAVVHVDPKASMFLLNFTVDATRPDSFVCDFATADGRPLLSLKSDRQTTASFNLPVLLPVKSFPAGQYEMRLHPASEPDSITRYPFVVVDDGK